MFKALALASFGALTVFTATASAQVKLAERKTLILDSQQRQLPRLVVEIGAVLLPLSEVSPIELASVTKTQVNRRGEWETTPAQARLATITLTRVVDEDLTLANWYSTLQAPAAALDRDDYQQDIWVQRLGPQYDTEQSWILTGCVPTAYVTAGGMVNQGPPPTESLTVQCSKFRRR